MTRPGHAPESAHLFPKGDTLRGVARTTATDRRPLITRDRPGAPWAAGREPGMRHPGGGDTGPAARILRRGARSGRLMHIEQIAARAGEGVPWPGWVPAEITAAFAEAGVGRPWAHQAAMAEHAHRGSNVIIATPAASGKSLGYLLPALTAVLGGSTVLYLAPTRALAADQLRTIQALGIAGVSAAVVDGDTHGADRERARTHANYLLTTPDMLHHVLLPRHARWGEFFGRLHYVIVDECHGYRGVFGSHVAHVLRRLQRVATHHARRHPARARAGAAARLADRGGR